MPGPGAHIGDRPAVGDAVEGAFDRDAIFFAKAGHRIQGEFNVGPGGIIGYLDDGVEFVLVHLYLVER